MIHLLLLWLIILVVKLAVGARLTVMNMVPALSASLLLAIMPCMVTSSISVGVIVGCPTAKLGTVTGVLAPRAGEEALTTEAIIAPASRATAGPVPVWLITTREVWKSLCWRTKAIEELNWARNNVLLKVELLLFMIMTGPPSKKKLL